jgi:hypothetical protein
MRKMRMRKITIRMTFLHSAFQDKWEWDHFEEREDV